MSTFADVVASLKGKAAAQINLLPVYWDKDAKPVLPDETAAWCFFLIETDPAEDVELGGGRGRNRYRVDGDLVGLVFLPRDATLEQHALYGEHVAAAFRSYRDAHVTCGPVAPQPAVDGSSLKPDGLASEVENYQCIVVAVPFFYHGVG